MDTGEKAIAVMEYDVNSDIKIKKIKKGSFCKLPKVALELI
jgi:hypothetical protein